METNHQNNPSPVVSAEYASDITKREYFAAQALIGLLSHGAVYDDTSEAYATQAVELADALIEALKL